MQPKFKKRAEWARIFIARDNIKKRELARELGIEPSRLSAFLNEAEEMPADLFESLLVALNIKTEVAERVCAGCGLEWDL